MKSKTNINWEHENNQHIVIVSTLEILQTCTYVSEVTDISEIPGSVFGRNQARRSITISPICTTDTDNNYILDGILC